MAENDSSLVFTESVENLTGENASNFENQLLDKIKDYSGDFLLDLTNVNQIDVSGIAVIAGLSKELTKKDGKLTVKASVNLYTLLNRMIPESMAKIEEVSK